MENYHKHENQYIYRQGKVWYLSYSINTQTAKARPFPGPESPSRCRFWLAHLCRPQPTHGGRAPWTGETRRSGAQSKETTAALDMVGGAGSSFPDSAVCEPG